MSYRPTRAVRAIVATTDQRIRPAQPTWCLSTDRPVVDASRAQVVRLYGPPVWIEERDSALTVQHDAHIAFGRPRQPDRRALTN